MRSPTKHGSGEFRPLHDKTFKAAADNWEAGLAAWVAGVHPSRKYYPGDRFWDYEGNPPEPVFYRPEFTEEPTWYQIYETVTEGTPVSPPFETADELIDWLAENGDFWAQKSGDAPPSRESAEAFVASSYVPSMTVVAGQVLSTYDGAALNKPREET